MSVCSKEGLVYHRMATSDVAQIVAAENAITAFPWTAKNFESCLSSDYQCWLLRQAGQHVGHAVLSVAAGEAELLNIGIAKEFQGKGFGRQLLDYMTGCAEELGARAVFLEVRSSNEVAQHLYASSGFNEVGIRPAYYPAAKGREDAVIMALEF